MYAVYCIGIASWLGWYFESNVMMIIALVVLVVICCEDEFFR